MVWRDTWHARYHVWANQPAIVLAAQVDSVTSVDDEVRSFTVKNITAGSVAAVKRDMTVVVGTVDQRDYYGRARVRLDGSGTTIYVQASTNYHDGELDPLGDRYVEVWDDYRVWLKPPYATGGGYYYDGGYGPSLGYGTVGTTTDQWPIANGGPAYAQFIDSSTRLITVDFDGSGSFAVADDAVLGGYTANLFGGSEVVTSTSGTAANAVDGNTATYCAFTTTAASQYIQVDWGDGNDQRIRQFTLTCHTANNPATRVMLAWSNTGINYVNAFVAEGITGWGSPSTQTFYVHDVGAHRYWRIYPYNASAGCWTYEWGMYSEDRVTSSPYSWDVGDGTITTGTSASESITATFPAGFRHVHLTVTDTNAQTHVTHIPVLAAETVGSEIDYTGSSYTQNSGTASWMFDDPSSWAPTNINISAKYGQVTLPTDQTIAAYEIAMSSTSGAYSPKTWAVHCDGNLVDTRTDQLIFANDEVRRYKLSTPCTGSVWRITVSDTHDTSTWFAIIDEWNLLTDTGPYIPLKCAIRSHVMEAAGQTLEIDLYQDLPESSYPDGTLILAWQEEYYDLTSGSLSDAGPSDREHMLFQGWIDTEPTDIEAEETGLNKRTSLRCIDTGGRLKQLADFSLMAERDDAPGATLGYQMKHANCDTFLYLMVEWLSTAASVSDFFWSNTADEFNVGVLVSQGSSIFDMIEQHANTFYHHFVCNKHNQIKAVHDPLASETAIRQEFVGITWDTLTAADYQSIGYTRQRPSRYHWVQITAVGFNSYDVDSGSFAATAYVAIAPGTIPGQGVNSTDLAGGVYSSRARVFAIAGNWLRRAGAEYARLQAPNSPFEIVLGHNGDNGIDPAELSRKLLVELDATRAAQRGLTIAADEDLSWQRGYVLQKRIDYDHADMTRTVTILWEQSPRVVVARQVIEPE